MKYIIRRAAGTNWMQLLFWSSPLDPICSALRLEHQYLTLTNKSTFQIHIYLSRTPSPCEASIALLALVGTHYFVGRNPNICQRTHTGVTSSFSCCRWMPTRILQLDLTFTLTSHTNPLHSLLTAALSITGCFYGLFSSYSSLPLK